MLRTRVVCYGCMRTILQVWSSSSQTQDQMSHSSHAHVYTGGPLSLTAAAAHRPVVPLDHTISLFSGMHAGAHPQRSAWNLKLWTE
jgi:hypothetical protein